MNHHKQSLGALAGALLLAACSAREEVPPERLRQVESRSQELTARVQELETQVASLLTDLDTAHQQAQAKQAEVEEREARILELEQRVTSLTQAVERARAYVARLRNPVAAPAPPADPRHADFIHAPVGADPDLFPVYIFNIGSRRVATGSHTEWKERMSGVTVSSGDGYPYHYYPDRYRPVEVKDFGYQAVFSLRNLTRTVKNVSVDAGSGARAFSLPPGGVLENQVLEATRGFPLAVTAGGETRSFNVAY